MNLNRVVGYALGLGLIAAALLLGGSPDAFVDYTSILFLCGGSFAIFITIFGNGKDKCPFDYQALSVAIFFIGIMGALAGLIGMFNHLNNPGNIGPSMAVALLTQFYALIFSAFLSYPLEDHQRKHSTMPPANNLSIVTWFALPLTSIFIIVISSFILLYAMMASAKPGTP